ncbi:MAG: transposase [Defluviimonas sp.]|nr:transposase [Defluviimonas sp.]
MSPCCGPLPTNSSRPSSTPLREIYTAPERATAKKAIAIVAGECGVKYVKAVECLTKDRERLLTFFDFPAEHWDHLRTSVVSRMLWKFPGGALLACGCSVFQAARSRGIGSMG